jgi:predicted phosphate transport protein (TIGR00153 family)
MLTIAKLFGKSPFAPLQTHMDKVASCVGELPALFKALIAQDMGAIQKISAQISRLEHEADLTKNDIRTHLPRSLFLPVDRGALLDILSLQDALADQAEKIGKHAAMRKLPFAEMEEDFLSLCNKNIEAFWLARKVMKELEELLEASFGGIEAQKVKGMVEQIAFCEYEMDLIENQLITKLYQTGDGMPYPVFHLSLTLIEEIGCLACISEKLGNRVRMLLELK